jgi:hypothetical protein
MLSRTICRSTYHDRCHWDTTERVFYIYKIGRFHNKVLYHYGETTDIYASELKIMGNLPFRERILVVSQEDYQKEIKGFLRDIEPYKSHIRVHTTNPESHTCFECFSEPQDHEQPIVSAFLDLVHEKHIG